MKKLASKDVSEDFEFIVMVPGARSPMKLFVISYYPTYPQGIHHTSSDLPFFKLVNNGIERLDEGREVALTSEHMRIEAKAVKQASE